MILLELRLSIADRATRRKSSLTLSRRRVKVVKQLFALQRTSRSFLDTIKGSSALKAAMWIIPFLPDTQCDVPKFGATICNVVSIPLQNSKFHDWVDGMCKFGFSAALKKAVRINPSGRSSHLFEFHVFIDEKSDAHFWRHQQSLLAAAREDDLSLSQYFRPINLFYSRRAAL